MIENYKWRDLRNAVGWAAACARLALPFYDGNQFSDVAAAIEIAERYAAGEEINPPLAAYAYAGADICTASRDAAYAAYAVAYAASNASCSNAIIHAAYAVHDAVRAGVSQDAVDQLQLSAIAVDLGLVFESETYFAAIAALAIGNIDWAREIAESSECA